MSNYNDYDEGYYDRPHDGRIPAEPSPRAPPPPRRFHAPQPEYTKAKVKPKPPKKPVTRQSLKKKQIKIYVLMVILIIFLCIAIYLATVLIKNEAPGYMNEGVDKYSYEFNVPNIMGNKIPVRIVVTSSDPVEFYVLKGDDYDDSLDIVEIRNLTLNNNTAKRIKFVYENELKSGKYVIISYLRNNDRDISLNYEISRFVLIPILWLISLAFIIPIILCVVWILYIQIQKGKIHTYDDSHTDYDQYAGYQAGAQDYYHVDHHAMHDDYGLGHAGHRSPPSSPSPSSQPGSRSADHNRTHYDAPVPRQPPTPPPAYSKGDAHPPPRRPYPHSGHDSMEPTEAYDRRRPSEPHDAQQPHINGRSAVTFPCKCGEIIRITDQTRPLRIQCKRCGRKGILEAKTQLHDEKIFY